jgi:hypothetical protein
VEEEEEEEDYIRVSFQPHNVRTKARHEVSGHETMATELLDKSKQTEPQAAGACDWKASKRSTPEDESKARTERGTAQQEFKAPYYQTNN